MVCFPVRGQFKDSASCCQQRERERVTHEPVSIMNITCSWSSVLKIFKFTSRKDTILENRMVVTFSASCRPENDTNADGTPTLFLQFCFSSCETSSACWLILRICILQNLLFRFFRMKAEQNNNIQVGFLLSSVLTLWPNVVHFTLACKWAGFILEISWNRTTQPPIE